MLRARLQERANVFTNSRLRGVLVARRPPFSVHVHEFAGSKKWNQYY